MPQLSPLMWIFSFVMVLFFLLGLILLDSNYIKSDSKSKLGMVKDEISLKW